MPISFRCKICGAGVKEGSFLPSTIRRLEESKLCFDCEYWEIHYNKYQGNYPAAIIDGKHYTIGNEKEKGFRGFNGVIHYIQYFKTKKVYKTTNLWCQGEIPDRFKKKFPNNAIFLDKPPKKKERKKCLSTK